MDTVPAVSPVTGSTAPAHYLHASSAHFRDAAGRTVLLRGINLSASIKNPNGRPLQSIDGFWESAESGDLSFVNQSLNIDDGSADVHLNRLKSWGFNCLRYVVVWEAIEHKGPQIYDEEFIQYTIAVLRKCAQHGFRVYIDPHQDLFSRFSGGSGAPYWTILACGLNPRNFTVTGAAALQPEWPNPAHPNPASFPDMIWASNYQRLAVATLFTLFWAGKDFAPLCVIDDKNIQDYLQDHYLGAYRHLAEAIRDAGDLLDTCVIGWDSWNEPNVGYVNLENINKHRTTDLLKLGPTPTAFQGMRLGLGEKLTVENYKVGQLGSKRDGNVTIDPQGKKAWMEPSDEPDGKSKYGWRRASSWQLGTCIWALHGVWDVETKEVLQPDYFRYLPGTSELVDYGERHWKPHWQNYARMVRSVHPEAIHFVQYIPFEPPPVLDDNDLQSRVCHSTHFYDGLTLITKHWNWFNADAIGIMRGHYASVLLGVKIGEKAIRQCFRDQLAILRQDCFDRLGDYPTMMGEIGIPYDLDKKQAYMDGNYANQTKALDASLNACDGTNMLNYSIWDYCPDNNHEWGDNWNGEDLSVWSADDTTPSFSPSRDTSTTSLLSLQKRPASPIPHSGLNDGARAISAFVRPYPIATVGIPTSMNFDIRTATLTLAVQVSSTSVVEEGLATEIYLPFVHFASSAASDELSIDVTLSTGRYEVSGQYLKWFYDLPPSGEIAEHKIQVKRSGGAMKQWVEVCEASEGMNQAWTEIWRCLPDACVMH